MLCRAKILRLKQHHKGQHGPHRRPLLQSSSSVVEEAVSGGGHGGGGGDGRGGGGVGGGHGVPQSVSNYSITRLSQSSSNHSFASGNEPLSASRTESLLRWPFLCLFFVLSDFLGDFYIKSLLIMKKEKQTSMERFFFTIKTEETAEPIENKIRNW